MSNRGRNFRRRISDGEDEEEKNRAFGTSVPVPSSSTTTAKTNSKPPPKSVASATAKPKKPSLLSFADDEENFSPVSRPISKSKLPLSSSSKFSKSSSSSSHKHSSAKDRISAHSLPSPLPSNVQPQAGTYTKEALLELQKNTKTLAAPRPAPTPSSEPVVVLKGLLKPDPIVETTKDNDKSEDNDEEDNRRDARDRFSSTVLGKGREDALIPDQATINAIRAKRERLRQAGVAAPDYIALDGGSNHGEAEGLSDEEPEFRGRIGLIAEKVDSGKKGVFEDADESGNGIGFRVRKDNIVVRDDNDEDEDEEDRIWEEEQFRKALGKRMDDSATTKVPVIESVPKEKYAYSSPFVAASVAAPYPSAAGVASGLSIGGSVSGFPGSGVMSLSQQAEITTKALHENMMRLKESHGRTLASLARTEENMSASVLKVTALENALSAAGEKFIFMQKLREFVSVICDFLQHKAPFIEELEEQMQKLHEERASSMLEIRSADNEDEMVEIEAAVNAAMAIFNKGGNTYTMIEMATRAAQAASDATKELQDLPEKLDEFGRDLNLQKRLDMSRRANARKRRKAQTDAKRLAFMEIDGPHRRIEGESSTDESDSETAAYQSNRDMLLQTADQIFSDAADDYSQLSLVMEKFERWKKDYPSSYQDAYMSLSIPSIFSPYVRLELLKWDPLHKVTDFIDMIWHSLLYNYGIEDEDNINPDDADANLVPQLVEKIAVPILHHDIEHCWDMLSSSETDNAVKATEVVIRYLPASSDALVDLVSVIHDRLAYAITNLMVPTWSPLVMKAVPNAARVAAYRFGTAVRLLRNICKWNNVLALTVLEKLALDDLLSGKILPHLRSLQSNVHDAVTRTERVIASLSEVWGSVAGKQSPKLQPLVNYLLSLGRTLEKKQASGVSEGETSGLPRRLIKMLVDLNEYDQAQAISRTFNLKVAL